MPPQQTSMPDSRTIRSVSQRSSQRVRGDHVREVASGRSPGCGCSGARPSSTSSSTCSWREHAERRGDLDVDGRADRGDALAHLLHQPLVRARARRRRCRTRSRRSRRSAGPPRPATGCPATPRAPARRTARTASRSGSPPGSRRSSARRCPRPRPRARTSASAPRGRAASAAGRSLVGQAEHGEHAGLVEADALARAPGRGRGRGSSGMVVPYKTSCRGRCTCATGLRHSIGAPSCGRRPG